jgi:hypothetical protein
MIHKRA